MTDRKRLTILGSTGSVGASTLDVVARHRDRFEVVALTAHHQTETLFKQCAAFHPAIAVMLEPAAAAELQQRVTQAGLQCEVR
jgi:1-deoxy-D-xylulose-5-phosphate reductoisomerase